MKTPKDLFANRIVKPPAKDTKHEEWWQQAGKEMSKFFGKNCYWIFWKYPRTNIDRAYHIAEKTGDRNFSHFLNNIIKG